jgi:hypothetical protein
VLSHVDTARLAVASRSYRLEFRNPEYKPISSKLEIAPGQLKAVWAAFYTQMGHITVRTADGQPCTVVIDGQAMPNLAPSVYSVKPGKHKISGQRAGTTAREGVREVKLGKDQRIEMTFSFGP